MEMIKSELKEKYQDNVITIWFDAWRYEGEEYSAMIPLIRTITLSLEDALKKLKTHGGQKRRIEALIKVKDKFKKVGAAVSRNTTINLGIKAGSMIDTGAEFDVGKIHDDYKSDGSFMRGQERIYFHNHISDQLKEQLLKIRDVEDGGYDFRIVIFVDDLDRCTPQRALELIESIKTFFDIEGIVYVLGMDPRTIDPIIRTKYEDKMIDGMNYLQKIVQLPFQIPLWNVTELSRSIRDIVKKAGMSESEMNRILDQTSIDLITIASKLNPRDVKRFINSHIILARYIYEESIEDIQKIIAVQAFYFRGKEWLDFLKLISPYEARTQFFKYFLSLLLQEKDKESTISTIEDLNKLITDINDKKETFILDLDRSLLKIFKKLIDINDNDFFAFLRKAAMILLKIDNIDKYIRATEMIGLSSKGQVCSKISEFNRNMQLQLLRSESPGKFNQKRNMTTFNVIHFPEEDFHSLKLMGINLSNAFLPYSKMKLADLSGADLRRADLFLADLSEANLSEADLSGADLRGAKFSAANLSRATLNWAKLNDAYLSEADLTEANLFTTDLRGAELGGADLCGADLRGADLRGASLREADLRGADLSQAVLVGAFMSGVKFNKADLTGTDLTNSIIINVTDFAELEVGNAKFKDAVIDDSAFIDYLQGKKIKPENIPEKIKDKRELRRRLEHNKTGLDEKNITFFMGESKLPD